MHGYLGLVTYQIVSGISTVCCPVGLIHFYWWIHEIIHRENPICIRFSIDTIHWFWMRFTFLMRDVGKCLSLSDIYAISKGACRVLMDRATGATSGLTDRPRKAKSSVWYGAQLCNSILPARPKNYLVFVGTFVCAFVPLVFERMTSCAIPLRYHCHANKHTIRSKDTRLGEKNPRSVSAITRYYKKQRKGGNSTSVCFPLVCCSWKNELSLRRYLLLEKAG